RIRDREDIDEPVDRDEHGAGAEHEERARVARARGDRPHLPADGEHDRGDGQGPDHAVAEDLDDGYRLHRFQIDREDTPGPVGGEPVAQPETSLAAGIVHAESYGATKVRLMEWRVLARVRARTLRRWPRWA